MEKLNIAELLKDCPSGTKLYSTVHGEIELVDIYHNLIRCKCSYHVFFVSFHSDGRWMEHIGECVIFPSKDQRDWSKFQRPFKDGDILAYDNRSASATIFIYRYDNDRWNTSYYVGLSGSPGHLYKKQIGALDAYNPSVRFATAEEKQKLFDAIKANGYKWNPETNTLEKLTKFKVGDRIKHKESGLYCILGEYSQGISAYRTNIGLSLTYKGLEQWELASNKFDITTLKPFDKVLVRCNELEVWHISFFEKYNRELTIYPFVCLNSNKYSQCIPYKDNEHLLDTADDCDDFYKTW